MLKYLILWGLFCQSLLAVDLTDLELTDGMKIGVMPGSFSPVHLRHQELAENILKYTDADFIFLIANDFTPHKPAILDLEHRVQMLYEAFKNHPRIIVIRDANEFKFPRSNDIIRYMKSKADVHVMGVSGYDSITNFAAKLGVRYMANKSFKQDGVVKYFYDSWAATFKQGENPKNIPDRVGDLVIQKVYAPTKVDPHSSEIRSEFQKKDRDGLRAKTLALPKKVFNYIQKNKLYRKKEPSKLKAYCQWLFKSKN